MDCAFTRLFTQQSPLSLSLYFTHWATFSRRASKEGKEALVLTQCCPVRARARQKVSYILFYFIFAFLECASSNNARCFNNEKAQLKRSNLSVMSLHAHTSDGRSEKNQCPLPAEWWMTKCFAKSRLIDDVQWNKFKKKKVKRVNTHGRAQLPPWHQRTKTRAHRTCGLFSQKKKEENFHIFSTSALAWGTTSTIKKNMSPGQNIAITR